MSKQTVSKFIVSGDLTRFCMNTLTRKDSVLFSFIDGFNVSNAYIAAQGQLNLNHELFWQFAWKQNVAAIVIVSSKNKVLNFSFSNWPFREEAVCAEC